MRGVAQEMAVVRDPLLVVGALAGGNTQQRGEARRQPEIRTDRTASFPRAIGVRRRNRPLELRDYCPPVVADHVHLE